MTQQNQLTTNNIHFVYNDGGRLKANFKGITSDCVVRAIAIALELPYKQVYNEINKWAKDNEKIGKRKKKISNSRTGVYKNTYKPYLASKGWKWVACSGIGIGCTVHLHPSELPTGRIICRLSKHLCAVIDGKIHDIYDPSRGGKRCVYGYFIKK